MPDPTPSTLIHFTTPILLKFGKAACGLSHVTNQVSARHGDVTCFACRKSAPFITRHGVEPPTPPIKLSGVMQEHPIMAEMYATAISRGEDVPRYLHECSDCEYLGHTNNSHSDGTIKRVELYYCHGPEEGDVIARHSDATGDWVRGYTRSTWDPDLALAVVRSIGKGLLRANALGQFNH